MERSTKYHSFQKKKIIEGGFNHSPLNLNGYMRNVEEWNEVHIQQRAEQLAQIGRWGNGDVEVGVASIADIPKVMGFVQQAMDYQDQ